MPENRLILADVPEVSFYDPGSGKSPEDIPFPSCLAAAARYLGRDLPWIDQPQGTPINYGYALVLAASGMAFGLRWRAGWHMDNADHMLAADPNEIIRRAFGAVGYRYTQVTREGDPDGPGSPADEERYRTAIQASLQRGIPVLAFGVIGPPECCLITGYDEGDTLIGWNFFAQVPPWSTGVTCEPNGMFRKPNWFSETHSLLLIGEPVAPSFDLTDTLRWAVAVALQPSFWGHATGHAAYDAWASQLEGAFSGLSEAQLRERHEAHNNEVGVLAECRYYGGQFLRYQAGGLRGKSAAVLRQAADCFQAEHDLMWQAWEAVGGNGHPEAWRMFAEPSVRQAIIGLIRRSQAENRKATDLLAELLNT